MELDEEIKLQFEGTDPGEIAKSEDEITLDRYLRLRGRIEGERDRLIESVRKMVDGYNARINALDFQYGTLVRDIASRMLAGKKAKTLNRPWGSVGFRTSPGHIEIEDEKAVLDAVISGALPESCQRVKIEPAKDALNEYFKTSGEIPPGTKFIDAQEKFFARFKE